MRGVGRASGVLLLVICALLISGVAGAADLYVSGTLSVSAGTGETGGSGSVGALNFSNSGSDTDSSPVLGGTLGYAFPLSEMFPYKWEWPLPEWNFRVEFEGMALRDYEFVTKLNVGGVTSTDKYFTEGSGWGLLHNWWLDLPVHAPLAMAFGRIPMLEPLTMHMGGGVGMGMTEFKTAADGAGFKGKTEDIHLVWQVGAGFDYQITDRVSFGAGYRYVDLGDFSYRLRQGATPVGNFTVDLTSHELRTGLRVNFYSLPSPGSWTFKRPRFDRGR
ncbi:MAG: outer membrane beta-barrel protein [Myxococcota bacterium]|nr:outer membrane beta-barrel protein [Myxococcota bacterium]